MNNVSLSTALHYALSRGRSGIHYSGFTDSGSEASSAPHRLVCTIHQLSLTAVRIAYYSSSQPLQDAEKVRQLRSRIVQTLHGDPAASPLGDAHRLGAPYSSHRAPQRVRVGPSLAAALLDNRFEHPAEVFSRCATRTNHRSSKMPKWFFHSLSELRFTHRLLGLGRRTLPGHFGQKSDKPLCRTKQGIAGKNDK